MGKFENNTYSSKHAPIAHSYYTPYVKFLFHTGCRPEEAIALKWKHVEKNRIYNSCERVGRKSSLCSCLCGKRTSDSQCGIRRDQCDWMQAVFPHFLNSVMSFIETDRVTGGWSTRINITELRLTQQALLQAEQDRVAELAKTNQALKNSRGRLAANSDLDSFLGYVLLEITQQLNLDFADLCLYDPATETLPLELQVSGGEIQLKHQITVPEALLRPSTRNNLIWDILLETKQPFVMTADNGKDYCF